MGASEKGKYGAGLRIPARAIGERSPGAPHASASPRLRTAVQGALRRLQERLAVQDDFPHEIGVFLGYPVEDVVGFIENAGQNCKCCGCWKVYCDECTAMRTFAKFRKCRDVYKRLWQEGRSILQLTVAA